MKVAALLALLFFMASCAGTQVGNALDTSNDFDVAIDAAISEAEQSALGIIGESDGDTQTALSTGGSVDLFPNSSLGGANRFNSQCPQITRTRTSEQITISRTYTNCRPFRNIARTFDGSDNLTITRDASDNDSNDVVNRSASLIRDLTITNRLRQSLSLSTSGSVTATGTFPSSITSIHTVDTTRIVTNAIGTQLANYNIAGNMIYAFSGETSLSAVAANGTLVVTRNLLGRTRSLKFTDVSWDSTCCHPLSGSIVQTLGSITSTATFQGKCGSVDVDGETQTLTACD